MSTSVVCRILHALKVLIDVEIPSYGRHPDRARVAGRTAALSRNTYGHFGDIFGLLRLLFRCDSTLPPKGRLLWTWRNVNVKPICDIRPGMQSRRLEILPGSPEAVCEISEGVSALISLMSSINKCGISVDHFGEVRILSLAPDLLHACPDTR